MTVDDAALFLGRFAGGALASFEATRFATGRKNAIRLEINGSAGSLAFDFESMNELWFYDGTEDPATAGFRRILVTEPTHPYVGAWWPPGHLLGYEHSFTHEVVDLVTRPGRRYRPDAVVRRRPAGAAGAGRGGPLRGGRQRLATDRVDRGRALMARPITLFTGQWADLPFTRWPGWPAEWGYDGLEIACWGDHFDPWAAVEDPGYVQGRREILAKHGLQVYAISNHLTGQAVCDDPIDERHRGILPARVWGDGEPEGVRRRAAEAMQVTARAAAQLGVDTVIGFTGSKIWKTVAMFPPVPAVHGGRRVPGLRGPLEPDPGRLRRGRGAVRARGAPLRDRLRLLDHGGRAGRGRAPAGVRAELGPEPLRLAGPGPGRVPLRLLATGSTTWTART